MNEKLRRVQFYMEEEEYRQMLRHCEEVSRDPGNLALHALRQYMKRYPLKNALVVAKHRKPGEVPQRGFAGTGV